MPSQPAFCQNGATKHPSVSTAYPSQSSWFASDPSKAYWEKFSLIWAPLSMATLLIGVFGTGLYRHCGKFRYTLIGFLGMLPGILIPIFYPSPADKTRKWHEKFWVKAAVWIAIFAFYGNWFWTHYFYQLLGAKYLFESYWINGVPLVCYLVTWYYFSFYFSVVNVILRRVKSWIRGTKFEGVKWCLCIGLLAYATAVFEAVSIYHFPLYTYDDTKVFMTVGSAFYAIYFVVGFPMFFRLDEEKDGKRWSLSETILDAFAAVAIVTLLLDLWRVIVGDIYSSRVISFIPFIHQQVGT